MAEVRVQHYSIWQAGDGWLRPPALHWGALQRTHAAATVADGGNDRWSMVRSRRLASPPRLNLEKFHNKIFASAGFNHSRSTSESVVEIESSNHHQSRSANNRTTEHTLFSQV
jgi:hypothetical protein